MKVLYFSLACFLFLACSGRTTGSDGGDGGDGGAVDSGSGDGGVFYGTLDDTGLGKACESTESCPNEENCVIFWGLNPPQSTARCVATRSYCELVTCVPGRICSTKTSSPAYVGCIVP